MTLGRGGIGMPRRLEGKLGLGSSRSPVGDGKTWHKFTYRYGSACYVMNIPGDYMADKPNSKENQHFYLNSNLAVLVISRIFIKIKADLPIIFSKNVEFIIS